MSRKQLADIIAAIFIFLFVYTAMSKLMGFDAIKIRAGFLPALQPYAVFIGVAVPVTELLTVLLLVMKRTRLCGLVVSLVLMGVFTGYIGWMLWLGVALPCTCGGVISRLTWPQHLWLNVGFMLLGIVGIWCYGAGVKSVKI
ncbi:hypothetical protein CK934_14040 [Chitinophaga sp. MD30]|nr:hypothetical protein CK934_14040 [Chitinophaga sp. MD30]